jgi:RNA polymerase sigma factor (sigma-70 family)
MATITHANGPGPGRTDAELARAAAAGDRRAFAGIYDRYADRLHDFCIGMLRNRDSAADCVQDTFCTAAANLTSLREMDKLRPWLYSIARNEALKRLRERRRERPSDELPDVASSDAGPTTLAHRLELANLVAEAAGGLSDRDRTVLELTYRHGMDGPELAEALGVSQTNAGTMVHRLRDTIERCLGALLVSRRVQSNPARCPQLAAVLHGWDGQFTVLMRKRVSRHVESCSSCEGERRRLVNPVALLGGAPVLVPAPHWLRDRTMRDVELTSSATGMSAALTSAVDQRRDHHDTNAFDATAGRPEEADADTYQDTADAKRRLMLLMALLIGVPLLVLGVAVAWMYAPNASVAPIGETETSVTPMPTPGAPLPTANQPPASTARPQPTNPTRATPTTAASVPVPTAGRTTAPQATSQPSGQMSPTTPLPTPLPTTPAQTTQPGTVQAPPPTSAPPPLTTYVPPPPDEFPPLQTYGPGPYTQDPTFVPPN